MVPDEYTDRILPGEPVFLAPNGRFHRAGCRYYVAPGPQAVFIEGNFTPAFLRNCCKLCFPHGVQGMVARAPASAGEPSPSLPEFAMPRSESLAPPSPTPPAAPADVAPPVTPETALPAFDALGPPPPPPPAITLDPNYEPEVERGRRKKKRRRTGSRTAPITGTQVMVFVAVVGAAVGVFAALAVLLHWFG